MISFIVATTGRETLKATLASIECWPGDEVLVVGGVEEMTNVDASVEPHVVWRFIPRPPGEDWGHAERNFAMPLARGQYIAHIDDDDVYVANHRAIMERQIRLHPERPIIFRMRYPGGQLLWTDKVVRVGNVGTPMSLLPNKHRGEFGSFYGGDMRYLESYAAQAGYASEDFVWCEETTVRIRPHLGA